jgi:hypothetical protein
MVDRIIKVEPHEMLMPYGRKLGGGMYLIEYEKDGATYRLSLFARDELDAYQRFMEKTKGT